MNNPPTEKPKRRLGSWKAPEVCPGCEQANDMRTAMLPTCQVIQGEQVHYVTEKWHCAACGAEWMSPAQATASVARAVEAFHHKHEMLAGSDVRARRELLKWTQEDLVRESGVSIASIKRLESGVHVLSKLHNDAITNALKNAFLTKFPVYEVTVVCTDSYSDYEDTEPSKWGGDTSWSNPVPWSSEQDAIDSMFAAADSNELALAV